MIQSRWMSLAESLTNIVLGYGVAVGVQLAIFPLFSIDVSLLDNMALGAAFTAVSVARSFTVRRAFEALRR